MEDAEREGNVEDDSAEARADAAVEAHDAVVSVDRHETVPEAVVLGSVQTLHVRLDHVDGVVRHAGAEAGNAAGQEVREPLLFDVLPEEIVCVLINQEANSLVRRLLYQRRGVSLVDAAKTLVLDNGVAAMEDVAIARIILELIVDELRLQGLLGRDHERGFDGAGHDATKEIVLPVLFRKNVLPYVIVGAESDIALGHREE